MAEVQEKDRGGNKKGRQKKMPIHVDFTPMVDMNMLLICFFMLATTMLKPQTMDITMPSNEKVSDSEASQADETRAITILIGGDNEIFYYTGRADYTNLSSLKQTNYEPSGLRAFLIGRNQGVITKVNELRQKYKNLEMSKEDYDEQVKKVKSDDKQAPIVIIKPSDQSNYKNLIDVLDEMELTSVPSFTIQDITDADLAFIENAKAGFIPDAETTTAE